MRKSLLISAIFLSLSVAGCSSKPTTTVTFQPTEIDKQMYKSVLAIQQSLRVLSEVKNAQTTQVMSYEQRKQVREAASAMPPGLQQKVTMSFSGEAETALQMLSTMTSYQYLEPIGKKPKGGVMVEINARDRPAYDVIHDIGAQSDVRAIVFVKPASAPSNRGTIQIKYKG